MIWLIYVWIIIKSDYVIFADDKILFGHPKLRMNQVESICKEWCHVWNHALCLRNPLDFSVKNPPQQPTNPVLIFKNHLGRVSFVTSPKEPFRNDWLVFGRHPLLCHSFVIVFLASILEKIQSMHLCTVPNGNNERIKYSQFSGVGCSHKYVTVQMLK